MKSPLSASSIKKLRYSSDILAWKYRILTSLLLSTLEIFLSFWLCFFFPLGIHDLKWSRVGYMMTKKNGFEPYFPTQRKKMPSRTSMSSSSSVWEALLCILRGKVCFFSSSSHFHSSPLLYVWNSFILFFTLIGHPALIGRHRPFPVTHEAAERWLLHMQKALDDSLDIDQDSKIKMMNFFRCLTPHNLLLRVKVL